MSMNRSFEHGKERAVVADNLCFRGPVLDGSIEQVICRIVESRSVATNPDTVTGFVNILSGYMLRSANGERDTTAGGPLRCKSFRFTRIS